MPATSRILLIDDDRLQHHLPQGFVAKFRGGPWEVEVASDYATGLKMCDIDHFKRINDTHGHQVGDEVLKHVASLLAGQLRLVDRVARYGGEEFGIIMIETDRKQAVEGMERIYALLAETPCIVPSTGLTIPVALSCGVAELTHDATTGEGMVAAADAALYAAKKAGRNRIFTAHRPTPAHA